MRTHENTLWILCQPVSPVFEHDRAGVFGEGEERAPGLDAERERRRRATSAATVAPAANTVRQRPVASSTSGIIKPNCGL